jgi:hypothetical protein
LRLTLEMAARSDVLRPYVDSGSLERMLEGAHSGIEISSERP